MSTEISAVTQAVGETQEPDESLPATDGDVFCEDDGAYIGEYTTETGPPLELCFQYKGHFFIYKLDRKEKIE